MTTDTTTRKPAKLTPKQSEFLAAFEDPNGAVYVGYNCPTIMTTVRSLVKRGLIVEAPCGYVTGEEYALTDAGLDYLTDPAR